MASKLQMLCDQYSLREQHLEKLGKQYDIERQLNEAKVAKIQMDSAETKEKMLKEKQLLLMVDFLVLQKIVEVKCILCHLGTYRVSKKMSSDAGRGSRTTSAVNDVHEQIR